MLAKSLVALLFATLVLSCSNNQKFKTVTIGDQVWMAENLNVDKFRNGDQIPHAQTDKEWQEAGQKGQPAWCYYDNDLANGKIYGKLYNWYAVNDWRGLAPEGWRVPSDEDWEKLIKLLGGDVVAGGKLKETDWSYPNTEATNETGFTALPGSIRNYDGSFGYNGYNGYWWSNTESTAYRAWFRRMSYDSRNALRYDNSKFLGLSVRCVKD